MMDFEKIRSMHRSAAKAIKVLEALIKTYNTKGYFPMSFCINDYDVNAVAQVMCELGYPNVRINRWPTDKSSYCLLIHL